MIDDTTLMEYGQEMIVIREIFDGAHELFENELERAFEFGCPTIVIEPCRLGEETARWIFFGEYLTRYSIVTGIGSILAGYLWPENYLVHCSLLGTALLTHGIHLLSWQQDICSNYRVEPDPEKFLKSMALSISSNDQSRSDDNVSLVTSTQEFRLSSGSPPLTENEEIDEEEGGGEDEEKDDNNEDGDKTTTDTGEPQQQQKSSKSSNKQIRRRQHQHHHQQQQQQSRPTNPYEMIWSTSIRKNKPPVVLCRRSSLEIKQSNILNAAVSLLAIAFSFIRFVRSSFFSTQLLNNHSKTIVIQSSSSASSSLANKWSFLRNFCSL